jgi:hypothetical protein
VLRVCSRPTIAATQHLATTGNTGKQRLNGVCNRFTQQWRGVVFEISTVNEMLLNSLFKHARDDTRAAFTNAQNGALKSTLCKPLLGRLPFRIAPVWASCRRNCKSKANKGAVNWSRR